MKATKLDPKKPWKKQIPKMYPPIFTLSSWTTCRLWTNIVNEYDGIHMMNIHIASSYVASIYQVVKLLMYHDLSLYSHL